MEPKVAPSGGRTTVIGPLVYVPDKELARFAGAYGFPVGDAPFPAGLASKRARMKDLPRGIEEESPQVKVNLLGIVQGYERKGQA